MVIGTTHRRLSALTALFSASILLQACGTRSPRPSGQDHIRGIVQTLDGQVVTVVTSAGSVPVQLAASTPVGTVVRSDRQHIADGSFLGITSVTQPDGSQRAVEVHVFPESMRGTGEGSYGWDLPGAGSGRSKMTNGAVASSRMTNGTATAAESGSVLTLSYYDGTSNGAQMIAIPPDIPIVAIEPGQPADLRRGVHVFIVAHRNADGALMADRVLAGKDDVVPPM